jgi:membrane protein DedA with SNARE-associated domain/membrane-associated phospholipid phosphatase
MDLTTLQPLLHWLSAHPGWSSLVVFLIAFAESLLLVGLLFPGTVIMFGIGTLVAVGVLDLWTTLAWAAVGAMAGDGISFWLGYHYKDQLRLMWPISRYPSLVQRGEQFFLKHGGKSVLFGRFVGPVRPILPAVAGMLRMHPVRFVTIDILSGIAWAPVYTLPGVLFGASIGVASEIASRLAVLVLAMVVILWFTAWLVHRVYSYVQPRGTKILERLLNWGAAHRYAGTVVSSVLDPQQSEVRGLAILGTLLVAIALLLVTVGHALFGPTLTLGNNAVFHLLQGLRVPWADRLMAFLTELGSGTVLFGITLAVIVWLAWQRVWLAVIHCVSAAAFAFILTIALDWSRDAPLSSFGTLWASGPVVMSTVLYGLLAVMVTQGLHGVRRWIPYASVGTLMMVITLSQLYLGAVWVSQVASGALLAFLWVIILGAAYRLHAAVPVAPRGLTVVAIVMLLSATALQTSLHYERDLARLGPHRAIIPLAATAWWDSAWRNLPPYRIDLEGRGKQPLTLQWSGSLTLLKAHLRENGWQAPLPLTGRNILQWLRKSPPLSDLPLLPQAHDGRFDVLRLIHRTQDPQHLAVLRLWSANYVLREPPDRLWVGSVTMVHASSHIPWLTVPVTGTDFDAPLRILQTTLSGLEWKSVQRPAERDMPWNGSVVLVRASAVAENP